jgi:large subunit ribosomal protein LP0
MTEKRAKKIEYFDKLKQLLEDYPTIFIVNVDNVGSNQMHQIRINLRADGVVLMGKNTMVRRALKLGSTDNPQYEKLLDTVKGNIGFVFTKGELKIIRDKILANRVKAPAKAGAIAPVDVVVPAGNTGMEPGKTSFFQALGIPTKIARGTIEIVNDVPVIRAGNKVGASEATLLNMLNISPFTYGMSITAVYDMGTVFPPEVLDIDPSQFLEKLSSGVKTIASISLALGYINKASAPVIEKNGDVFLRLGARKIAALSFALGIPTKASVPHMLVAGYKNVVGVSLTTDFKIKQAEKFA